MLSFQIVHPISYNFYLLSAVSIVSPGSSNPPGNPNLPSNLESEYPLFFSPCTLPEMHIYKGKVWMLIPEFFFCPAKVGSMFHNASNIMFLLHLAKNIAWAARLYFSSPRGSKCFSTSTQSSSIALKAWPELQRVEDNLTDLRRGKLLCILQNKVCYWICFFFLVDSTILKYWNNICVIQPDVSLFDADNFHQELSVFPPSQSWAAQSETQRYFTFLGLLFFCLWDSQCEWLNWIELKDGTIPCPEWDVRAAERPPEPLL